MQDRDLKTSIAGYMQAGVAIFAAFGLVISPENANAVTAGSVALLGILGAIKGHFTKDK